MKKTLVKKAPEHVAEILRVREVAANFKALIEMKQSEYDTKEIDYDGKDLLAGTEYENSVTINESKVDYISPLSVYIWMYTPRCGSMPASLHELWGFE